MKDYKKITANLFRAQTLYEGVKNAEGEVRSVHECVARAHMRALSALGHSGEADHWSASQAKPGPKSLKSLALAAALRAPAQVSPHRDWVSADAMSLFEQATHIPAEELAEMSAADVEHVVAWVSAHRVVECDDPELAARWADGIGKLAKALAEALYPDKTVPAIDIVGALGRTLRVNHAMRSLLGPLSRLTIRQMGGEPLPTLHSAVQDALYAMTEASCTIMVCHYGLSQALKRILPLLDEIEANTRRAERAMQMMSI